MRARSLVGVGVAAVGLTWSVRRARGSAVSPVSSTEERVFRAFNDAPDLLAPLVWPVMQTGSLAAVAVSAVRTRRAAGTADGVFVAVVGTALWGGIKLVKPLVGRGRPAVYLPRVRIRGVDQTGLGFPSGHAAVSVALALVASPTAATRRSALAAAAGTGAGRMYVGAHLPLDIVGGAAVGWLAGTGARAISPTRARRGSAASGPGR